MDFARNFLALRMAVFGRLAKGRNHINLWPVKEKMAMPNNPNAVKAKLDEAVGSWRTLRPNKSFGGMTVSQFTTAIQPSYAAREQLLILDKQRQAAADQRDAADAKSIELLQLVINSIKGDPAEGEDGELYEAMGYVRKSERQSGLHRGANHSQPAAPAAQ
jgi:hypothetical protein